LLNQLATVRRSVREIFNPYSADPVRARFRFLFAVYWSLVMMLERARLPSGNVCAPATILHRRVHAFGPFMFLCMLKSTFYCHRPLPSPMPQQVWQPWRQLPMYCIRPCWTTARAATAAVMVLVLVLVLRLVL
jgi:hypothetical protein